MDYSKKRIELREPVFKEMAETVGGKLGRAIADEFRDYYTLFEDGMIDWYANLYDVKYGGYYYSNSARDNDFVTWHGETYPLLPDTESTIQALNAMDNLGLTAHVGGSYKNLIPEWMFNDIVAFIKGIQHPNGFFYHPQWGKEAVDKRLNRRGRDLVFCCNFLKKHGLSPYYDTPNGQLKGEKSAIPDPSDPAAEVAPSVREIPEHLLDKEHFIAYLEGHDMSKESYHFGNELCTQMGQIGARDRELLEMGKDYQLFDIMLDWLEAQIDPNTGHWSHEANNYGINGFLKTGSIFNARKRKYPYIDRLIESIIAGITSSEPTSGGVDLFNMWWSFSNAAYNMNHCYENGEEMIEKMYRTLLENAPNLIRVTKEKQAVIKKPDGSFSYGKLYSSPTSQDMPVAIPNSVEGDINGNGISGFGTVTRIANILRLGDKLPGVYFDFDARRYMDIIEGKRAEFLKNN